MWSKQNCQGGWECGGPSGIAEEQCLHPCLPQSHRHRGLTGKRPRVLSMPGWGASFCGLSETQTGQPEAQGGVPEPAGGGIKAAQPVSPVPSVIARAVVQTRSLVCPGGCSCHLCLALSVQHGPSQCRHPSGGMSCCLLGEGSSSWQLPQQVQRATLGRC